MHYPTRDEIISIIKYPIFIKYSFFENCFLELKRDGEPINYGGGFSQVFVFNKNGEKWAFKIWICEIKQNYERYKKISAYLSNCNLPYFSEFYYIKNGLLANNLHLDILRMKWVEGLSLIEYISFNLRDTPIMEKLAEDFLLMINELHKFSISHGDLQHGNIFINNNGEVKLIDYDSICVPELNGQVDFIRGYAGYQHPSRFTARMITSTKIDYFSELIIYISILAIIENPLLWDQYNVVEAERLLFTRNDFHDFENSKIRRDLYLLSPKIQALVNILENYLAAHINLWPFNI